MPGPDLPTVAAALSAADDLAATHDEIDAMHRKAFDDAAPEPVGTVESGDTESGAH